MERIFTLELFQKKKLTIMNTGPSIVSENNLLFWLFFGYIFFFPTYVIGPFIEYNDYDEYVTGEVYKQEKSYW